MKRLTWGFSSNKLSAAVLWSACVVIGILGSSAAVAQSGRGEVVMEVVPSAHVQLLSPIEGASEPRVQVSAPGDYFYETHYTQDLTRNRGPAATKDLVVTVIFQ